jgi:hypothetical protein
VYHLSSFILCFLAVGFESPNFGHAFLDGFDDFDRDEYTEDTGSGYSGDELPPSRAPRNTRGDMMGRNRTRGPAALEGAHLRAHPPSVVNGLRDLSASKWQDKHSPDEVEQYNNLLISEPEPSLDDRLLVAPPDWATCCVCHEVSLTHFYLFSLVLPLPSSFLLII